MTRDGLNNNGKQNKKLIQGSRCLSIAVNWTNKVLPENFMLTLSLKSMGMGFTS